MVESRKVPVVNCIEQDRSDRSHVMSLLEPRIEEKRRVYYFFCFCERETLRLFRGLVAINSGLADPDDESDESGIDPDEAMI